MNIILGLLLSLLILVSIFLVAVILGNLIYYLMEKSSYPETRSPKWARERLFSVYLAEIRKGNFSHSINARILAFFSLRKRIELKKAEKKGYNMEFVSFLHSLRTSKYLSYTPYNISKMVRKDSRKLEKLQKALLQRKSLIRSEGFTWNTEWDAYIYEHLPSA